MLSCMFIFMGLVRCAVKRLRLRFVSLHGSRSETWSVKWRVFSFTCRPHAVSVSRPKKNWTGGSFWIFHRGIPLAWVCRGVRKTLGGGGGKGSPRHKSKVKWASRRRGGGRSKDRVDKGRWKLLCDHLMHAFSFYLCPLSLSAASSPPVAPADSEPCRPPRRCTARGPRLMYVARPIKKSWPLHLVEWSNLRFGLISLKFCSFPSTQFTMALHLVVGRPGKLFWRLLPDNFSEERPGLNDEPPDSRTLREIIKSDRHLKLAKIYLLHSHAFLTYMQYVCVNLIDALYKLTPICFRYAAFIVVFRAEWIWRIAGCALDNAIAIWLRTPQC